jgi:hypothetical protein
VFYCCCYFGVSAMSSLNVAATAPPKPMIKVA